MSKKKDAKWIEKINKLEAEVNTQKELIELLTDSLIATNSLTFSKIAELEEKVYGK